MEDSKHYRRDQVVNIISSVIRKVEGSDVLSREMLYTELKSLHELINDLRKEISSKPEEILEQHIPSATDELDAIVKSTAEATGGIMDACEAIENIASDLPAGAGDKITEQVISIYEACSFQDITGQRITKVITTLKQIDGKVERILDAFGPIDGEVEAAGSVSSSASSEDASSGDSLLNGPQLPENAISQDDIDKLLAEFD